jgi:hypothetical protein
MARPVRRGAEEGASEMKFRLEQSPWVIGPWTIPAGTVLDFSRPNDFTQWAAGKVPPLTNHRDCERNR